MDEGEDSSKKATNKILLSSERNCNTRSNIASTTYYPSIIIDFYIICNYICNLYIFVYLYESECKCKFLIQVQTMFIYIS